MFEPPRFMTCQQAAQQLLSAVQVRRENKETSTPERTTAGADLDSKTEELRLEASSEVVCVARVGAADQRIVSCSLEQASTLDMGKPLHSLVIPGMSWFPCMFSDLLQPVFRIRIRIGSGFNQVSGSGYGSRRAKMTHKNIFKKVKEISCFEVLYVLF